MYFPLSLNSWLMMAVGLLFFFGGVYYGISHPGERVLAFGLVACGVGFVFFGFTEGFTDPTPRGKLLYRIAIISFIVGLPIVLYNALKFARLF